MRDLMTSTGYVDAHETTPADPPAILSIINSRMLIPAGSASVNGMTQVFCH